MRPNASSTDDVPTQFTSVAKLNAARMPCRWESINPGITVLPFRSMTWVDGPASLRTLSVFPTAVILPSLIPIASCVENCESTVRIFPFTSTVSAVCDQAGTEIARSRMSNNLFIKAILLTTDGGNAQEYLANDGIAWLKQIGRAHV